MSNLRIRIKYRNLEIELDGDKDTVKEQFNEIKNNGLGNIVENIDLSEPPQIIDNRPILNLPLPSNGISPSSDYPNIKEVIMKQLPSSEPEWVLIYIYFTLLILGQKLLPLTMFIICMMKRKGSQLVEEQIFLII